MFGDLSKCASPHVRDVADAQHSFASGHSAVAFAGMTFTCLYLRAALGVNNGAHFNVHSACRCDCSLHTHAHKHTHRHTTMQAS